eukprot:1141801-Pelagomonas_calceolata.AAC.2
MEQLLPEPRFQHGHEVGCAHHSSLIHFSWAKRHLEPGQAILKLLHLTWRVRDAASTTSHQHPFA